MCELEEIMYANSGKAFCGLCRRYTQPFAFGVFTLVAIALKKILRGTVCHECNAKVVHWYAIRRA